MQSATTHPTGQPFREAQGDGCYVGVLVEATPWS